MSEFHKAAPLTDAIVAALEAEGLLVGDAIRPDGGGWWDTTNDVPGTPDVHPFVPYVDVWPVSGGVADGTLAKPYADAHPDYILRVFAANRAQCEFIQDVVWEAMLSLSVVLTGRQVQLVRPDVMPGVFRDDDVQPPVFFAPSRWRVWTTPA